MKLRNIFESSSWFEVLQTSRNAQSAVMTLAPGAASGDTAEAHGHSDQILLVVSGSLKGTIGAESLAMRAGDVVIVPAGVKHRFWNEAETDAVTFNVYSPPEYPPDTRD